MIVSIKQTLHSPQDPYYVIYAHCAVCQMSWGWRDDDSRTTNYADLKAEVSGHLKRVHNLEGEQR